MNRQKALAEAAALNSWKNSTMKKKSPCDRCDGRGRLLAPVHGDENLGYADAGACPQCGGTGTDNTKLTLQ